MRDSRFDGLTGEQLAALVAQGNKDARAYLLAAKALNNYNRKHSVSRYEAQRAKIRKARAADTEREAREAKAVGFSHYGCSRHARKEEGVYTYAECKDTDRTLAPRVWQKKQCRAKGNVRTWGWKKKA
jgi:hypothetical protein